MMQQLQEAQKNLERPQPVGMRGFDNRLMLATLKITLAADVHDQIAKEKR